MVSRLSNDPTREDEDDEKDATKDKILKLCELEYKAGVRRHDDIYKSMWTNFYYVAILAAAILTFGKDQLKIEFLFLATSSPLLFWFWASFLPLDRYGNAVARRMAEIEKFLNSVYFGEVEEQAYPQVQEYSKDKIRKGLFLYSDFENRKKRKRIPPAEWLQNNIRVKHPVWVISFVLHVLFIGFFIMWAANGYQIILKSDLNEKTEKELQSINTTLQNMNTSISNMGNSIRDLENRRTDFQPGTNGNLANMNSKVKKALREI